MSEKTTNHCEWLAAGELERGQHIIVKGGGTSTVYTVEHSLPYRSGKDPMVALTLAPVGGGEPHGVKWSAEYMVRLASEDQVAEAVDAAHRRELVAGLRELADLIEKHKLRFKEWYGPDITAGLADGEVSRIAKLTGVELRPYGNEQRQAVLDLRESDAGDGITVSLHGRPAPEPQPEAQPEHRHVSGSSGELPGQCSAVCACGMTFDGFDTVAEAVAELDKHIANPEPDEVEQEWLFTFGSGQQHDGRFVRITGTPASARARMFEVFGNRWFAAYDWASFDAEGLPAKLTELPEAEWPTPADDAIVIPAADVNAFIDRAAKLAGA